MVNTEELIRRDLNHIWHPCSQMKDFEQSPPFVVYGAQGSYIKTNYGDLIDANSSWWCKSLGHGHPEIIDAIQKQALQFEHVISANSTHENIVHLAQALAKITNLKHSFFASDGSCAVEIALKLALHAMQIKGDTKRNRFIALKNAYHGETLGTLSVSDVGIYKKPYQQFGLECYFINNVPYVSNPNDTKSTLSTEQWQNIENELAPHIANTCAIIVEPLVQGAGGMHCYSADFLRKLADYAKKNGVYLIADEIMTGIGRTGKWLACEHSHIQPDMVCLSKGLTSGSLPLSCVSIDEKIFELFYDDYEKGHSFLHSHTFSGNPLAVSAALATVRLVERDNIISNARRLGQLMRELIQEISEQTNVLSNLRGIGAIVAGDLKVPSHTRLGYKIYQIALKRGAFLRPLGNTIYWMPPLNTDENTIRNLAQITLESIEEGYKTMIKK